MNNLPNHPNGETNLNGMIIEDLQTGSRYKVVDNGKPLVDLHCILVSVTDLNGVRRLLTHEEFYKTCLALGGRTYNSDLKYGRIALAKDIERGEFKKVE